MLRRNTMGGSGTAVVSSALAALSMLGCGDTVRNTELDPDGPPRVLQVFVRERVTITHDDGSQEVVVQPHLAYGEHPDLEGEDGDARDAVVGVDQKIRIVVDELLRGNFLEEIACADGSWSQVPVGTDPDDIRDCTGADLSRCRAVCVGVGVKDENGDRALDDTRMIAGAVTLTCAGVAVPIDVDQSFWQPSGNQLIPAGDHGIESLGPAVVIVPAESLPTGADCTVALAEAVVDKDGIRPCAPAGGIDADCAPGDLTGVKFTTEPLQMIGSDPHDGQEDVALTADGATDAHVTVHLNGFVDPATAAAAGFSLTAGDAPVSSLTVAMDSADPASVVITVPGGFQPSTRYELTVASEGGLKDKYGAVLAAAPTISWTTKAAAVRAGGERR